MSAPTLFATDTLRGQLQAVIRLSIPAVLSQISATAMQYIDATMVGSLGANASAAIGLVSSSTWLLSGLCAAAATGFSVQVAHRIGAGQDDRARAVVRQAVVFSVWFGCCWRRPGRRSAARCRSGWAAPPTSAPTPRPTS